MGTKGKRFKDFDVKFAAHRGTALSMIESRIGKEACRGINTITRWSCEGLRYITYPPNTVHYAVYEHCYAEEWQKFRVSLKGLSTKEKLFCLMFYWEDSTKTHEVEVRINNYIGALIRGGCLSTTFEVIR